MAKKRKGYYEITIQELVDAAGGRFTILAECGTADDVADRLFDAQENYIDGLLTLYEEVGEVDPTDVLDWADNAIETATEGA